MIKTIKILLIIILLFSTPAIKTLYGEDYYNGLTITASTGPSYTMGFFRDYLKPGISANIGTLYSLPFFGGNTYFKSGFSYHSYELETNRDSLLRQGDFNVGGMISYPLLPFILVDAGFGFHGIYSDLNTEYTNNHETAFKPGISVSGGAMAYLGRGIGLFVDADYMVSELSDEYFRSVSICAGVTYNYNDYKNDIENLQNADKKIKLFDQGNSEFRKKNFDEAKRLFSELYNMDRKYPGLDYYMKRMEEIEQNYKSAEASIEKKNYIKAITFLESCSPYIKECELKLFQQRKNLKVNVPAWEKEGIRYYDEKQYKECINIMERILIVDPENRNANIYLPRAVKRNKAIESLQGDQQ